MSQLLAPTHTLVDKIPLGRRIAEIMHEKGTAYTISAMAKRLELNRETLRLMLKGEREIYTFELEKIAKDLKFSVERILQSDVVEERERLNEYLRTSAQAMNAIELSDELVNRSNGLTEKCNTLNQKARCRYILGVYDDAHEVWFQALPYAQLVQEKFRDPALLVKIVSNLTLTYTIRNDQIAVNKYITIIEPYLHDYPEQAAVIYGVVAGNNFRNGEFEEARKFYYLWLQISEKINDTRTLVRAVTNTATIEYRMQNYTKANELYERVAEHFTAAEDPYYISLHYLEYAKTLFRLNKMEKAKQMIEVAEKFVHLITVKSDMYAEAQVCFLKAIINSDTADLEKIVYRVELSENLRKIYCKYLSVHYKRIGDSLLREKYHNMFKVRYLAIDILLLGDNLESETLLNVFEFVCGIGWHVSTNQPLNLF